MDGPTLIAFGGNAPRIDDSNGSLSQEEESRLYQYYGLNYSESRSDSGLPTEARSQLAERVVRQRIPRRA